MAEYIERDKLQVALQRKKPSVANKRYTEGWNDCLMMVKSMVHGTQAADVTEVRHGHWIDCEDEYSSYVRCSVCGDEYTNWEADCAYTNFCPGCGAKMDGGAENA